MAANKPGNAEAENEINGGDKFKFTWLFYLILKIEKKDFLRIIIHC